MIPDDEKATEIILNKKNLIIGRHKRTVDVLLNVPSIGKYHAELIYDNDKYYVRDLNSLNGTFINGVKLSSYESKEIQCGDQLAFASLNYRIKSYE